MALKNWRVTYGKCVLRYVEREERTQREKRERGKEDRGQRWERREQYAVVQGVAYEAYVQKRKGEKKMH